MDLNICLKINVGVSLKKKNEISVGVSCSCANRSNHNLQPIHSLTPEATNAKTTLMHQEVTLLRGNG